MSIHSAQDTLVKFWIGSHINMIIVIYLQDIKF